MEWIEKGHPVTDHPLGRELSQQARVWFGDGMSKSRIMRQGLLHSSVLSPLPFITYINNMANLLPESETIVMFADDVTILSTRRSWEEATKAAQAAWSGICL